MATHLKFRFISWTIRELIEHYKSNSLDLQPHYQRNAIWTAPAQRGLIKTIKSGYPLPNIFLRELTNQRFEIVDGQQRCRTILSYNSGDLADADKVIMNITGSAKGTLASDEWRQDFLAYPFSVAILDRAVSTDEVQDYYVILNSTGSKLNTAELRKAAYHSTNILGLANRIADSDLFTSLNLFSDRSKDRMNDIDFISELLTFVKYGHTDKKLKVREIYEEDIESSESEKLFNVTRDVLRKINDLNEKIEISHTRFKQKNDFYTLFAFLERHPEIPADALMFLYETIIALSPQISPSQEMCDPLREYALNCVSQSNSKSAREKRESFFNELFQNNSNTATPTQSAIAEFFGIEPKNATVRKWGLQLLNNDLLQGI